MTHPTMSELEKRVLELAIPPKGTHPTVTEINVKEATIFAQNIARKSNMQTQVLIALSYLEQYGYSSRYVQQMFDRR